MSNDFNSKSGSGFLYALIGLLIISITTIVGAQSQGQGQGNQSGNPSGTVIGNPITGVQHYHVSSLLIRNNDTLTIDGPVIIYVDGDVDIRGTLNITARGNLQVYTTGDVSIRGTGTANLSGLPERLAIYGMSTKEGEQSIDLSGNGAFVGVVYAPYADLSLRGGGNSGVMMGAAVADTITINGNYSFHYDEALDDFHGFQGSFKIDGWRELFGRNEMVNTANSAEVERFFMASRGR